MAEFTAPATLEEAIRRGYFCIAMDYDEQLVWSKRPLALASGYYAVSVLTCGFVVPSMAQEMIRDARAAGAKEVEVVE